MANKGTSYITDPDSIPVTTDTGNQSLAEALNARLSGDPSNLGVTSKSGLNEPLAMALDDRSSRIRRLEGKLELIAHRGFRGQFPQNTLMAMSLALRSGADSLECDVQPSSDGELFLYHDTTVNNLTTSTGTFSDKTAAEIRALTFKELDGTIYETERPPTFAEFLSFAKREGVFVYPEIKSYRTTADIEAIVQAVIDADMEEMCMLQSFSTSDLQVVRQYSSRVWIGRLGSGSGYQGSINTLSSMGRSALLWLYSSIVEDPNIVAACRDAGMDIGAWTVLDDITCETLLSLGVYKQMADYTVGGSRR